MNLLRKIKGAKPDPIKEELVSSLAEYLMGTGMNPSDSFKLAKDFWDKNYNKLKDVLKY